MPTLSYPVKRFFYPALLTLASTLFANCATICGGSRYYAHIEVNGKANAKIFYDGALEGTGRAIISVKRQDAKRFNFTVQQDGCEQQYRFKSRTFRGWALVGSLVTWGYLGPVVDLATGAYWKPNDYEKGVQKLDFKNFRYTVEYTAICKTQTKQTDASVLQKESGTDVLYLKNGIVIRGSIIENKPEQHVQIRIEGGDIVLYPAAEIDRIEKENVAK